MEERPAGIRLSGPARCCRGRRGSIVGSSCCHARGRRHGRGVDDRNLEDAVVPAVRLDEVAPGAELGEAGGRVGLDGEEGREPVLGRVGEGRIRVEGGVGLHRLLRLLLLLISPYFFFVYALVSPL